MSVTGDLVDQSEHELRRRYWERKQGNIDSRSQQDITSSELAEQLDIDDSEGNPETREAVKIAIRERGQPIIGGGNGYYIPVDPSQIEDAIESLDGRIAGIQERKQLIEENWRNWNAQERMFRDDAAIADDGVVVEGDQRVDGGRIRRRVATLVREDAMEFGNLVTELHQEFDVERKIQALHRRLDAQSRRLDNIIALLIGDGSELFEQRFDDAAPVWERLEERRAEIDDLRRQLAEHSDRIELRADGWGDDR